jgi:hemerythrin-like metal-binding protein
MTHFALGGFLLVGHAEIDAEHQQLVVLSNELMDILESGDDGKISGKIADITTALSTHLQNEERVMKEVGYRRHDIHVEQHREARVQYDALIGNAEKNGYEVGLASEILSILVDDFIKADMDFKSHLQDISYRE